MSEPVENSITKTEKPMAERFEKAGNRHAQAQIVGSSQGNNPKAEFVKTCGEAKPDKDEHWPLSGKPYFHLIISKSHLKPRYVFWFPAKLHKVVPSLNIPVTLKCCGKTWNLVYLGVTKTQKRFDLGWKDFAVDNGLNVGDACVFELEECQKTKLIFRVQILRGDFPPELLAKAKGQKPYSPIIID